MKHFIIDVDGISQTVKFYYDKKGKIFKALADDHDALNLIRKSINILFITGDKKGFYFKKKNSGSYGV